MREFKRVNLDGKGGDLTLEKPQSMFGSENEDISDYLFKSSDKLDKPQSDQVASRSDFTWKFQDRLDKPESGYKLAPAGFSEGMSERLTKPESGMKISPDSFTWKFEERLSKPEEEALLFKFQRRR